MGTKELREKAQKAIESMPPKALEKLVALLEELNVLSSTEKDDDALIEKIISENRDVLARLAK